MSEERRRVYAGLEHSSLEKSRFRTGASHRRVWNGQPSEELDSKIDVWFLEEGGWLASQASGRHKVGELSAKDGRDRSQAYDFAVTVRPGQTLGMFFGTVPSGEARCLAGCAMRIEVLEIVPRPDVNSTAGIWRDIPGSGLTNIAVHNNDRDYGGLEFQFASNRMR